MANSIDTALQGLRDASAGLIQFGKNRQATNDREAAYGAKKDEADAKEERLKQAGIAFDAVKEEFDKDPENFDTKKLAEATAPFQKAAAGDNTLQAMLTDLRNHVSESSKNKRAVEAQAAAGTRAEKKDSKDAEAMARQGRQELDSVAKAYGDEDQTKALVKVRQAYNRIAAATEGDPNGIKDIAAVTAYMKSIDEGSTVREGEFKTAKDAKSFWAKETKTDENGNLTTKNGIPIPSFIAQAIQNFSPDKNGAFLLPEQREALRNAAEESYRRQLQQQGPIDEKYKKRADAMKVSDYSQVIPTPSSDELKMLDSKTEARKKAKEEAAKTSLESNGPKTKVMDEKSFQQFFDMNKDAVTAAFQAAEKRMGRPLTPEEKNAQINALMKAAGVQTAPGGK